MSLPSITFIHLTVSEIDPRQDFNGQNHYKVKSRSNHDPAYLYAVFETRAKKLMAFGLGTLESWKPQAKVASFIRT